MRWATAALDVVRRWVWNVLRRLGLAGRAKHLKGCRYVLWKNPEDLTDRQTAKLAWIAKHTSSSTGPTHGGEPGRQSKMVSRVTISGVGRGSSVAVDDEIDFLVGECHQPGDR
ncbi:hypothetical protein BH20ACT3_BH20ACT3_17210 [soil metagenome]